ncbi:MAG: hypothetical protein CL704_04925 [Chloroflexi bacterium]|nr:hypothetical protein [Chloroflexota bacterium]
MAYTNNSMLIEASEVFEKLKSENTIIIDCDVSDVFQRAHIKNAKTLPTHHYIKQKGFENDPKNNPHIMEKNDFHKLITDLNINQNSEIIAYDNSASLYATRFWWCLNYFGIKNIKVLNGGWKKWISGNYPIESGFNYPFSSTNKSLNKEQTDIKINENNSYICKITDMKNSQNTILFDTRSEGEFNGTNSRGNMRAGHMPGAIHIEWLEFMNDDHNFKSETEIKNILDTKNITYEKEIKTY